MSAAIHPTPAACAGNTRSNNEDAGMLKPDGLVDRSLGIFSIKSSFRKRIIDLVSTSSHFDKFILVAIFLNSIAIASVDYQVIDTNYQPRTDVSVRNNVIEKTELIFTIIFTSECILKSIAYGFLKGKHAYIRDGWNTLDFFIVVISILGLVPGVPNLSVLRSCRVLRPLRSVAKLPSLKKIIGAFVDSIGDLANVIILLVFVLTCFTLFGITFWQGLFHMRCRISPFPLKMPTDCRNATNVCWDQFILSAINNPDAHRCLPFPNDDEASWSQSTSPWYTSGPQDCIWPIDESDNRVCSHTGHGFHSCSMSVEFAGKSISRTCGSNYDAYGNPRFIDSSEPYGYPRIQSGVFNSELNWGFTNFDDFPSAFVTTFQVITLEGWSDIMYRTIDAWAIGPSIIAFLLLIVIGGQIVINIVLAVISGSLDKIEDSMAQEKTLLEKPISPKTSGKRLTSSVVTRKTQEFVECKAYTNFILVVIFANTIVLSLDHYRISSELQINLDAVNVIITIIFFVDMLLCNIAHGLYAYWSTSSTCFDGIIVISSVVELIFARMAENEGNGKSVMSIFRSLRLVKLLKMLKQWKSLHALLETMSQAASDIRSFGVLLGLFVFVYALVGMQLFANRFHFDVDTGAHIDVSDSRYGGAIIPRSTFDDFFRSLTTIFQVLSGENWNEILYDSWKATSWVAPLYFISLVVLGTMIILNLFLAILLSRFDGNEQLGLGDQIHPEVGVLEKHKNRFAQSTIAGLLHRFGEKFHLRIGQKCGFIQTWTQSLVDDKRFEGTLTLVIVMSSIILALDSPLADPNTPMVEILSMLNSAITTIFFCEFLVKLLAYGPVKYLQDWWNVLDFVAVVASILELFSVKGGKSLRVLRTLRVLRPLKMIHRFPGIKLVVDALLLSMPSVGNVAIVCAMFFLVFAIFGVTFLKGTFYQCTFDGIETEGMLNLVTYPRPLGELNSTELSWLDYNKTMCRASSWDVVRTPTSRELCDCLVQHSEWGQTIPQNFDNVLKGFALLFEISTTEGWVDVMNAAIDQRGIDMQPVQDNNRIWALFFLIFLVLGSFFMLELFVGVIIENFAKIREVKGRGLMTEAQRQWASTQAFIMKVKPERLIRRPAGKIRSRCYDIVMPGSNPMFDRSIVAVIVANSISISTLSFGDNDAKLRLLGTLNEAFSFIFIVEAILKITAFGTGYFRDKWNRFDFGVVVGLVSGFIVKLTIDDQRLAASISSMVSLIRIGRLVRLVRFIKPLRTPMNTIMRVIPGIANIAALMILLFYVYAVCGVQLYGTIQFQGDLNEQANFRSVGNAMVLLLRFSTGENWNGFMWSLLEERHTCESNPIYDEASPWCLHDEDYPDCANVNGCEAGFSVFVYFYSFTLIVSYVALNMFVGVVLEAFENSQEGDILQPEALDHFVSVWAEFDPDATWYINASDLQRLFTKLRPPLGMGNQIKDNLFTKDQCLLQISVNKNKQVQICDVASHLAKRLAKEKQGEKFGELGIDHPLQQRIQKEMKMTLGEMYMTDAMIVVRAVRRLRQKLAEKKKNEEFPSSTNNNDKDISLLV